LTSCEKPVKPISVKTINAIVNFLISDILKINLFDLKRENRANIKKSFAIKKLRKP
jgi:hypothetical protein